MGGRCVGRRAFLKVLPAVPAGLVAGGAALSVGGAGATYLVPAVVAGELVVPRAAVEAPDGVFVQHPDSNRPVYVARTGPDRYVALHARCTHKGCRPEPEAGRLVCPCHGSEFDMEGNVLEGPAERPLTRYPATLVGADVHVRIGAGA